MPPKSSVTFCEASQPEHQQNDALRPANLVLSEARLSLSLLAPLARDSTLEKPFPPKP
jgi:hypothetical protein